MCRFCRSISWKNSGWIFGYDEVRVVFDRYVQKYLKTQTKISRKKGYSTVYRVMDETKINDLETKSFLSSIETKNDLTKYLSNKLANVFSERSIRYVSLWHYMWYQYSRSWSHLVWPRSRGSRYKYNFACNRCYSAKSFFRFSNTLFRYRCFIDFTVTLWWIM